MYGQCKGENMVHVDAGKIAGYLKCIYMATMEVTSRLAFK
jgi:hypothetical protein